MRQFDDMSMSTTVNHKRNPYQLPIPRLYGKYLFPPFQKSPNLMSSSFRPIAEGTPSSFRLRLQHANNLIIKIPLT